MRAAPCATKGDGSVKRAQQIGAHATLKHLALHRLGGGGYAHSDCLRLTDFVFQDAKSFIERIDEEVSHSIANRLLLHSFVGGCGERCRSADVAGDQQGATLVVELARVQQLSAKQRSGGRGGLRGLNERGIEAFNPEGELKRGCRDGI
jgi:hypothetical protein